MTIAHNIIIILNFIVALQSHVLRMTSKSSLSHVSLNFVVVAVLFLKHFSEAKSLLDEDLWQCFGCHHYYIVSLPGEPCPPEFEMCLTLNQFATNTSYLQEDTSLIFQREDHSLDTQLTVVNVTRLSLVAETVSNHFGLDVIIVCSENFIFENVSEVHIRDILFVNCTQNAVQDVEQITLDNCTFDRQNGTVFHINSSGVNLTNCRFKHSPLEVSYYDHQLDLVTHFPNTSKSVAIVSIHSIISVDRSVFEKKGPVNGVAIQVVDKSELLVNDTSFTAITDNGIDLTDYDVVHAYSGSSVVINYTAHLT